MSNTTIACLVQAMDALVAILGKGPITNGVPYVDAVMNLEILSRDPSDANERAMVASSEELIDDVRISGLPETPELVAAEAAIQAHLLA